jgi:hypothetical protein
MAGRFLCTPYLRGLIYKAIRERVHNTIRINGIHWYGAHMTPIGRHEPIRVRRHRILICGVLVHVTVTTCRRVGRIIIRTHREQEIVSSTPLGMRSQSCESGRYCLRHALATSVGKGKSCERHFLVKSPILFWSWRWERVNPQSAEHSPLFLCTIPYLFTGEISFRYCDYSPWMSVQSKKLPKSSNRMYVRRMYRNIASQEMAGNKYPQTRTSLLGDANGLHHGGCVVLLIVVIDKHKHHFLNFTEYLLWCMQTSLHRDHCHILDKG